MLAVVVHPAPRSVEPDPVSSSSGRSFPLRARRRGRIWAISARWMSRRPLCSLLFADGADQTEHRHKAPDDRERATGWSTTRMWVARRHPPAPTPAAQLDMSNDPRRWRLIRTGSLLLTYRKAPARRRHVPGPPGYRASRRCPVRLGTRVRSRPPLLGPRSTARPGPGSPRV